MAVPLTFPSGDAALASLQAAFLGLLPQIEQQARFAFRYVGFHDREEAIQETRAVAWLWYRRLCDQGKDATAFATVLAQLATRFVRSHRRLCGQENSRDVLSPLARQRHCFHVDPLRTCGQDPAVHWREALADNTQSPVDQAAAFRIDFPDWLRHLPERDRALTETLALGHRTAEVAGRFHLTPGRISQLRRALHASWQHFHGEASAEAPAVPATC